MFNNYMLPFVFRKFNGKEITETIKYFIMKDYYRNLLRFQKLKFSR